VSRQGFHSAKGTLVIPQTAPVTIQLRGQGDCLVAIELVTKNGSGATEPFIGRAEVAIETAQGRRIESMTDNWRAQLRLPGGRITLSATAPEADVVTPDRVTIDMQSNQQRTVQFEVTPARTFQNPAVQLLAFVCRRVPPSPRPK
jgi:hypothetical protein